MDQKIAKYLILIIFAVGAINCKAQDKVIPQFNPPDGIRTNVYVKDMDNDFNVFVGTWRFSNGNEEVTIEFKKLRKYFDSNNREYNDYLIGEYKYVKNGNVLINNLPTSFKGHPFDHNTIYSLTIYDHGEQSFPKCNDCPSKSRYISLNIDDPIKSKLCGEINMVHYVQNGVRKIKMFIASKGDCYAKVDDIVTDFNLSIADGEYIFTKVD